jgi:hypothetical protein
MSNMNFESLSQRLTSVALATGLVLGPVAVGVEFAPSAEAAVAEPDCTAHDVTPTVLETPAYAYEANKMTPSATPESVTSYKIPNLTPKVQKLASQILGLQGATLDTGKKPKNIEGLRAKGKQFMSGVKFTNRLGLTYTLTENSLIKHDPTKVVAIDEYVSSDGVELTESHFVKLASGKWNEITKAFIPKKGLVPAFWEHRQAVMKDYDITSGKAQMSTDLKKVNKYLAAQVTGISLDASPQLSGGVVTTG